MSIQFSFGRANQPWKEVHVVSLVTVTNMTISCIEFQLLATYMRKTMKSGYFVANCAIQEI